MSWTKFDLGRPSLKTYLRLFVSFVVFSILVLGFAHELSAQDMPWMLLISTPDRHWSAPLQNRRERFVFENGWRCQLSEVSVESSSSRRSFRRSIRCSSRGQSLSEVVTCSAHRRGSQWAYSAAERRLHLPSGDGGQDVRIHLLCGFGFE